MTLEQKDLLSASNLSVEYSISKEDRKLALDHVSLSIPRIGYTLGLVGESGSGKTTLGMSLMNLIQNPGRITSGEINYGGASVLEMSTKEIRSYRGKEVSMIFQSAMDSLNPVKTASSHMVEVLKSHLDISAIEARERALELLTQVGIAEDHANHYAHELSNGMRQRVMIALALALSPKIVIADEPTSALDTVLQKQIIDLLKREISGRGLSLLYITHDLPLLSGLVDHVSIMFAGEIVEQGPLSDVFANPLHPYTESLLSSLLTLDSDRTAALRSKADLQELRRPVADRGCKYQNRCKYAFDRCRTEKPRLEEQEEGGGRLVACHRYD